jgi:hypothetical protein
MRSNGNLAELGFSLLLVSSFKINFDIAIRDFFSAQAVVCRNHNGHIIRTVSQISLPCLPNFDEALATLLAVFLDSFHLDSFIIKGDSQVNIMAFQHPCLSQD